MGFPLSVSVIPSNKIPFSIQSKDRQNPFKILFIHFVDWRKYKSRSSRYYTAQWLRVTVYD
jgi:hypothetical protein